MAGLALLFAAAYFAADVGINLFGFSKGWMILWPLNGVTVALLLMRPRSDWAAMLLGVAVGTGCGELLDDNSLGQEICLRLLSVMEVLLCAALLPAFTTLQEWLHRPRLYERFFAALVLGPGISGVLAAVLLHAWSGQGFFLALDNWAVADALGIAATMPFVLALRSPEMKRLFSRRALPKTVGVLGLAVATAVLSFWVSRYRLLFLLYPALLLVDSVLEFSGSAIAVLVVSFVGIFLTTHGYGPFSAWPPDLGVSSDVALQLYLAFQILALFPASILFLERRRLAEELQESNAQLLLLASLDGLTGIGNRRSLDERFVQEWSRGVRLKTPLALVMIDVDHFKQFNDLYGHPAGDVCLHAIATAIADQIRRALDFAARYGGEEFALLLPHTDMAGAQVIAETVRKAIFDLAIPHRGSPWGRITVSVGYSAATPAFTVDHLELLKAADQALYAAKGAGRNRINMAAEETA